MGDYQGQQAAEARRRPLGGVTPEQFLQFVARRRSTRLFQDRAVPAEAVERIIRACTEAPSSCNRQLWHVVVVDDQRVKQRISRLSNANQSFLYDAPILLCVFYDVTLEAKNPCKTPYISAGMALQNMLLQAEAEGLGAIYLGGIRNPTGVRDAVEAPDFLVNMGVICLGYRADDPPAPDHRTVAEVSSHNHCRVTEPAFHNDIRPYRWSLRQLADFREKLLWYKGIAIDVGTLHVENDSRRAPKYVYVYDRLGQMIANAPTPPTVLDVMSYNGDALLQLMLTCDGCFAKIYAYELTEHMRTYMDRRLADLQTSDKIEHIVNEGLERIRIPLPDNSVDVVNCCERVDHFVDPVPLLSEMQRVTRPGGRALIVFSNRFYPHLYHYKRMRQHYYALGRNWNRGPTRKIDPVEMRRCLREAGWEVVRLEGLQPIELKIAHLLGRLCRKAKLHRWSDWCSDLAAQLYVSRGITRYCSSLLAYEVRKP